MTDTLMKYLFFGFLFLISTLTYAQQIQVIHAGTVFSVPGEKPLKNQTIVIDKGRIVSVKSGFQSLKQLKLKNAVEIDLKDKYIMPGFIDLHTHVTGERDPHENIHLWTTQNEVDEGLSSIPYLEKTLMAGFTTVRNLGANYQVIIPLKNAVKSRKIMGPRIIAATSAITPTGGHADFHGYRTEILEAIEKSVGVCDGADDCRRAVREAVKQGADVIKITATGGVLSNTNAGVGQQLTDDELKAIVETANSLGRKVAAHAHAADGINAALRAGVNSIEHGSYLDETSVKLFKEKGAYLVPTLLAGVWLSEEMAINDQIPPAILAKIKKVVPEVEASFKLALNNNVKIAFGTDSGVSKHGYNAREFELLVKYGMKPMEAIKTATVNAADLLGMSSELGTLEKGKIADLVATDNDPLKNISELRKVSFVMKEGVVFKR